MSDFIHQGSEQMGLGRFAAESEDRALELVAWLTPERLGLIVDALSDHDGRQFQQLVDVAVDAEREYQTELQREYKRQEKLMGSGNFITGSRVKHSAMLEDGRSDHLRQEES